MNEIKKIIQTGKFNYDSTYDLLYLKINDFDYKKSIEINNLIIDFDDKKRITGIEVLDAAEFFNVSKQTLMTVKKWLIKVSFEDCKIYLNIEFEIKKGNKTVIKNPIIVESLHSRIPNAELICAVS